MCLHCVGSVRASTFRCTLRLRQQFHSSMTRMRSVEEQIKSLQAFSACDVSDALLKLQKPLPGKVAKAGYLADMVPFAPSSPFAVVEQPKVIAPASTLKLIDKSNKDVSPLPEDHPNAIPKHSHWADITEAGTVLVVDQPRNQTCAAVGGIMASRMKLRGLAGCVVSGRVRDLAELKKTNLPVWAAGRSTVGQGGEAKVYARNITVQINDVDVAPGDIVFCDPLEGVVVIPQDLVEPVIELMPKLVEADDRVKADVEAGSTVQEAFTKHRG